ncbi:MAG: DNA-processing protein DprA [Rubricoccaceae bacterium]
MSAPFALALLHLDGVGRVAAHRLLERFGTYEALRAAPREQVRLRLKGVPGADAVTARLFDDGLMADALARARAEAEALAGRGVALLAPGMPGWPPGLTDLGRGTRPVLLYAFGNTALLGRPTLAVLGRPPLPPESFEHAQLAARHVWARGGVVATGARHGLDLALIKLGTAAGGGVVAVVEAGLARLTPSMRPGATALVRAGGLLVSPFAMTHGPFAHDDRERAAVQVALARAALAVAPEAGTPEDRAMAFGAEAGRALFVLLPAPPDAPWTARAQALTTAPDLTAPARALGEAPAPAPGDA